MAQMCEFMRVYEMKTQRYLRMNLALAATGVYKHSGLKHFPLAESIFIFYHIYTSVSRFPYAQKNLNEASKNTMASANT